MIVYLTLFLYLAVLVFVGYLSYRKINNHIDFFVAGKNGSTLAVTGSLLATILGGSAIIGAIDAAPRMGWSVSWYMICAAAGLFALIPFAGSIRKLGRFTLPDLLESMHGTLPKKISSYIIPLAWIGIVAAQIIASAKILESFAGLGYGWGVVVSGAVFVLYTLMGGQFSILRTDLVQSVLVILGLGVIAWFVGRHQISHGLSLPVHFSFFNPGFSPFDLLVLVLTYSTTFTTGPDIYSRLFCARNKSVIQKSLLIAGLVLIPVSFTIGFLGVSGSALVPNPTNGTVLINLSKMVLPEWAVSLMVVALLSAVLSSADTTLLSASVIVSDLILKGHFGAKTIMMTRKIILIIGFLSTLLAWNFTSIIDTLLMALAVYAGAFTLPIILGLFKVRFKPKYLSSAILSGGSVALIAKLFTLAGQTFYGNALLLASFFVSGLVLLLGRAKTDKN